jgi:hypothetical protein
VRRVFISVAAAAQRQQRRGCSCCCIDVRAGWLCAAVAARVLINPRVISRSRVQVDCGIRTRTCNFLHILSYCFWTIIISSIIVPQT